MYEGSVVVCLLVLEVERSCPGRWKPTVLAARGVTSDVEQALGPLFPSKEAQFDLGYVDLVVLGSFIITEEPAFVFIRQKRHAVLLAEMLK